VQVELSRILVVGLASGLCVTGGCAKGRAQVGESISVGRCQARLVYRPGWILYGDVYIQIVTAGDRVITEVHVTQVDMPPEQFGDMHLVAHARKEVRVVMRGFERQPYQTVAPIPRPCLE
jgi:hypothetical protein